MAKALGSSPASSPAPNTHLLSQHLTGSVGLLFTPRDPARLGAYFARFRPQDYARAGARAPRGFTLPPGVLCSRGGEVAAAEDVPLPPTADPGLRRLGVPTRVVAGRVELAEEHVVCREGEVLGSGQTALLKMFGVGMAEFVVGLRAYWARATGEVGVLGEGGGDGEAEAEAEAEGAGKGDGGELGGGEEMEVDVDDQRNRA
jgi:mRNA turnover protein 4